LLDDSSRGGGLRRFADLGGGRGELCGLLARSEVRTVLVDLDQQMLAEGTRPAVRADIAALSMPDASVDAAAAVNCLYFLADQERADTIPPPLEITKKGAHVWTQR
jgi:ubiquinone/menaquinone biosynthesis C-methylase UbiE